MRPFFPLLSLQLCGSEWSSSEECHTRDNEHTEGVAAGAQEESVSHERGENYARNYYENDVDSSVDVVCQCQATVEEGE